MTQGLRPEKTGRCGAPACRLTNLLTLSRGELLRRACQGQRMSRAIAALRRVSGRVDGRLTPYAGRGARGKPPDRAGFVVLTYG
ncbi:hypothetical protein PSP6_70032 [Paraburkholderia tropica]|nr:hypothetical protein PSP6_70032 [Paraburkholderia tropica]